MDQVCTSVNNRITIEVSTGLAFSEDVSARCAGLGWAVHHVPDVNDLDALNAVIEAFRAEHDRPTLMQQFGKQPQAYRDEVLPPAVTARVAIEKAGPFGWDRWVGSTGAVIGMSTFGESAP